jgi:hypothetical protein
LAFISERLNDHPYREKAGSFLPSLFATNPGRLDSGSHDTSSGIIMETTRIMGRTIF